MTIWTVSPSGPLTGSLRVPGDKSVSHRSLLFNAIATGTATVTGLLESGDVQASRSAVEALGAVVEDVEPGVIRITGTGDNLAEPGDVIDCGNSGTSIRLLCGLLAAHPFLTVLTGDHSLRSRPMARVAKPLRELGARIDGREDGRLAPLVVRGGELASMRFDLSIASAQVKTCLLLAGRRTGISVREPRQSRDHTERLLTGMGADLTQDADGWWTLGANTALTAIDVDVPGDLSAAAFWLVAASIVPGSDITLRGVGLNPTRAGVIDALRKMGANIEVTELPAAGAEPIGDIRVQHAQLHGARIDGDLALRCLDELPVLSVAAAVARGVTVIADAEELRVKESDRIARTAAGLRALGIAVTEAPDGMTITGGRLRGGSGIDGSGDHRITMAFAVAACAADGPVTIEGADSITSSYPAFPAHLDSLRG